ncbi:MAG: PTS fructose transporter subunit IIB [Roseburia inulinivorans]
MAAEALEKKAKELGYRIKVETRGSGGAKNVLTKAEIAEAECIIVATRHTGSNGSFRRKTYGSSVKWQTESAKQRNCSQKRQMAMHLFTRQAEKQR